MNLNRAAVVSAMCAMAVILTGALVTGKHTEFAAIHATLGIGATLAGTAFAFTKRPAMRWCGIAAGTAGAVECLIRSETPTMSMISTLHAFIAPIVFTAFVALIVFTSGWQPVSAGDGSAPLRRLVFASPWLVLIQIALGAVYRHKLTGVLPHMAGAMLIAGFLLIVCALVMQRLPEHGSVKNAAAMLLSIVLLQVSLGIAAFLMRLLDVESHPAFAIISVSHVCVGSLTLAASAVLAIQFPRGSTLDGPLLRNAD